MHSVFQDAKLSANTALLETKLGIEITGIRALVFFICSDSHSTANNDKNITGIIQQSYVPLVFIFFSLKTLHQ